MIFNITTLVLLVSFSLSCFASHSVKDMTLEEKAGQVLMVHFNGEEVNEHAKALIQDVHVGGFIYYNWANGLHSPQQVRVLSEGLQRLSAVPLLIAVDQEGGLVARLTSGFTVFPGNKALGMTGDSTLSEECAFAIGKELHAVGVNFNLSPVVDVNSNPRNPVIGIRSFGDSTDTVIPFAERAIQGYHKAGILVSLKHFPGHGDVEVDSHEALPVVKKSKEQLQKVEFLPFAVLAQQADTIMTAHIIVPSIDSRNCATLSKKVLDILRDEMGFEGVVISDSLVMEGLLKNCASIEDAAIRALNAGCDILLLGGKQLTGAHVNLELTTGYIERIHRALVEAVNEGLVEEKRLDEAVQRILNLKEKYKEPLDFAVNSEENKSLAKKVASRALKVLVNKPVSLQKRKMAIFAPAIVKSAFAKESPVLFFRELNPSDEEIKQANEMAKNADALVFCSYNAWKNPQQIALANALSMHKKPFIVISLRDPLDAILFPQADLIITTYSPTAPSIEAALEVL